MDKKICNVCNEEKELADYNKSPRSRDGLKSLCKICDRKRYKKYCAANTEKLKEKSKRDHQKRYYSDIEGQKKRSAEYAKNNPKIRKAAKKRYYEKHKNDPAFVISNSISNGIRKAIKEIKANRHWEELVGYTLQELMAHLESKFDKNMNWDNYGSYWHIDHIRPKSWFLVESTDDQAFKKCWALDNLQPLEASKNMSKCNRWEG